MDDTCEEYGWKICCDRTALSPGRLCRTATRWRPVIRRHKRNFVGTSIKPNLDQRSRLFSWLTNRSVVRTHMLKCKHSKRLNFRNVYWCDNIPLDFGSICCRALFDLGKIIVALSQLVNGSSGRQRPESNVRADDLLRSSWTVYQGAAINSLSFSIPTILRQSSTRTRLPKERRESKQLKESSTISMPNLPPPVSGRK